MTYSIYFAKFDETRSIDFDAMPENAKRYIIEYGLKKALNDVHSAEKNPAEASKLTDAKLENLMNGVVKAQRSSGMSSLDKEVLKNQIAFLATATGNTKTALKTAIKTHGIDSVWFTFCQKLDIEPTEKLEELTKAAEAYLIQQAELTQAAGVDKIDIDSINFDA